MYSDKYYLNLDVICKNETQIDNDFIYPIDGLENRYSLNKNGLMYDNKLSRIKAPIKYLNTYVYEVMVNSKVVRILIEKVFLMAFSPMHIKLDDYLKRLSVNVRNHELGYLDPTNINWVIPEGGIECHDRPGFYSIVGIPELIVSKDYVFKNYRTNSIYSVYEYKSKSYPTIGAELSKEKNVFFSRSIHRIIALAFLPFKGNKEDFYVNHKDGNKDNFSIENLEWVSHLENNLHAIANGLRTDSQSIRMTNVSTGEVKLFHSAGQCAKFFNNVPGTIIASMDQYKRFGYLKFSPWLIQYQSDPEIVLDESILDNLSPSSKLFYSIEKDGETSYYFGIDELKIKTGISRKILSKYPRRLKRASIEGYIVSSFSEYEVSDEIRKQARHRKRSGKLPIPITVTNNINGEIKEYPSTEEFAKEVGFNKKSIQHVANRNNGRWRHYHLQFHEKTRKPSQNKS